MKAADARVLLTGGTGGIGQAAAAELVAHGASVMLAGRSPARLSSQARLLNAGRDGAATWHEVELGTPASIDKLAGAAAAWGCNVVVHGAGAPAFGAAGAVPPQQLQEVLTTNLLAPMTLTHALLPHLLALPRAQVLFVGSVLGAMGLPGFSAYCASKFGLRGYAQALRRELGPGAVGVQYLGPRSTRTDFNDSAVEAYNRATGTAMDEAQQVARALLKLLEDEAPERFLGFPEKLAVRLNGAVPGWLDAAFAGHRRALHAAARPTPVMKEQ